MRSPILLVFVITLLIKQYSSGDITDSFGKMLTNLFIVVFLSILMYFLFCRFHGDEQVNICNQLLIFDQKNLETFQRFNSIDPKNHPKYWISTKLVKTLTQLILVSLHISFFTVYIVAAELPLTPWNLFLQLIHLLPASLQEKPGKGFQFNQGIDV